MTSSRSASGRALALLLGLLAVAAIVFLVAGDPFGGSSSDDDDERQNAARDAELLGADGDGETERTTTSKGATLGSLYGAGDMGAIRLRILWVGSREPVAGQPVQLLSRRGTEVGTTPSGPDGVVTFSQVRPSKGYVLHVEGEGFSEVVLRGITVRDQATTDLGDLIVGKDIVLRGRVVDSTGRPVPGSSVSVHTIERRLGSKGMLLYMAEQARTVPLPLKQARSDEEGYFAFSQLDDGTYALVARHSGYGSKQEGDVIVARERGAGVLTLVLGDAGHLTGRVTDADGKPVVDAQVMAIRDTRRFEAITTILEREVATTAADGSYVLDTLVAGVRYRFGVVAEGYAPVYEVQGIEITEKDMERDFQLVLGGNLEGVVLEEESGKPVEGATVAVYVGAMGFGRGRQDPNARAAADTRRTDAQGRFRFEAVTPGPVASAVVKAPGYVSATYSMWPPPGNMWPAVVAGETQQVEAKLKRGGSLHGVVRTAEEGTPVQGAEVTVMATGWAAMGSIWIGSPSTMSTADGTYEIVGVPPGKYRVIALADGFTPAGGQEGVEITIPPEGGTIEQNLELSAAGNVEGIVVDPAGEPIGGVRIRLRPFVPEGAGGGGGMRGMNWARSIMMAGRRPSDLSDEKGYYRLSGVSSSGQWVVYGESEEYVTGESKPFQLAPGDTKKVGLTMLAGGALRGRVVDENGRWLAGVRVRVGHLDEEMARQRNLRGWQADRVLDPRVFTSDDEGRFLATNLKPGLTIVKATKDDYITFYKRNVKIKPGETFENYTISLSSGETIDGTVRGADGRPLEGAMVALTTNPDAGTGDAEGGEAEGESSDTIEASMFSRTDAQGRYEIEHVPPGTYSVVIWFAPGHKGWARDRDSSAIRREILVPAQEIDFKLIKAEVALPGGMGGGGGGRGNR